MLCVCVCLPSWTAPFWMQDAIVRGHGAAAMDATGMLGQTQGKAISALIALEVHASGVLALPAPYADIVQPITCPRH